MTRYKITMLVQGNFDGTLEGYFEAETEEEATEMAYASWDETERDVESIEEDDD